MDMENEDGSDGEYDNYMDAENGDELDAEHDEDYIAEHDGASENIEQVMPPPVPVAIIPTFCNMFLPLLLNLIGCGCRHPLSKHTNPLSRTSTPRLPEPARESCRSTAPSNAQLPMSSRLMRRKSSMALVSLVVVCQRPNLLLPTTTPKMR